MTIWPPVSREFYVSQYFGERSEYYAKWSMLGHYGIDIPGTVGEPLHAGVSGRMYSTQTYDEGIRVHVYNSDGTLKYAHCSCSVGPTRNVKRGEIIALLGNTGDSVEGDGHVHIDWTPAQTDYNNGYCGRIDPWPLIQEGMMELDKIGPLATEARWWAEEEIARRWERIQDIQRQIALLQEQLEREQAQMNPAIQALINPRDGKAYAVEIASGQTPPSGWQG